MLGMSLGLLPRVPWQVKQVEAITAPREMVCALAAPMLKKARPAAQHAAMCIRFIFGVSLCGLS